MLKYLHACKAGQVISLMHFKWVPTPYKQGVLLLTFHCRRLKKWTKLCKLCLEFCLFLDKTMLCLVDTQVLDNLVWDLCFLTENRPGSRQIRLLIGDIDTSWSMTFHFRRQSAILQPIKSMQSFIPSRHQLNFRLNTYVLLCMFLRSIMYSRFDIGTLHRCWGF